jgi:CO/xanthine dehydrogenase FAD-binding subunit
MKEFEHINATSINETLSLIKEEPDTSIIAGGTDLLPRM